MDRTQAVERELMLIKNKFPGKSQMSIKEWGEFWGISKSYAHKHFKKAMGGVRPLPIIKLIGRPYYNIYDFAEWLVDNRDMGESNGPFIKLSKKQAEERERLLIIRRFPGVFRLSIKEWGEYWGLSSNYAHKHFKAVRNGINPIPLDKPDGRPYVNIITLSEWIVNNKMMGETGKPFIES